MGQSQKKRKQKARPAAPSLISKLRTRWIQKWPVLVFVLGFAVLMMLFYAFWLSDTYRDTVQPKIVLVNAVISSFILNLFGMHTIAVKENITSPAFSVCIANGCDAVEAMALFASALLSFPARWKYKLAGFFAGIVVLATLNIIRIISLFLTGIYYPKAFELMHVEVWQVLFILFAIGLWIFWIKWTRKEAPHA
jgi:exosortase H (IPTLxxWG-CTERM-specific)